MKFRELALYLKKLEKTSSRNEITSILADLFSKCSEGEIKNITYLVLGQLAPKYRGVVLNIAERMMLRIISRAYGEPLDKVRSLYKTGGDLGDAAESLAERSGSAKKDGSPTTTEVFEELLEIADEEGAGSQERKVERMSKLLTSLDALSVRFVARIPVGRLRLGFSDMTVLDALSFVVSGDKSSRKAVEEAFNVRADAGAIAELIKEKGLKGIGGLDPTCGVPIRPSLAERLPSAEKILEKVGKKVAVEPKYDGFRTQVHVFKQNGQKKVMLFSRNLENTTEMFPDIVEEVKKLKVGEAIFDAEAIAYDKKSGKLFSFQETVRRKRKHEIDTAVVNFPLKLFIFDILYKDSKSLLNTPFSERRKILEQTVKGKGVSGGIELTRLDVVDKAEDIRDLIKKYLSEGLEGAIIKKMDAVYKAGGRGYHWVKYKKTTEEGVADTIDCLVMGAYKGRGRRAGFGVGAFLAGVLDKGVFKTVSKIGTGLSDEQWRQLNTKISKITLDKKPKVFEVDKNLEPDIWVSPSLVVEILSDEITKSPIHKASLALRFPRLIRFRDDKTPEQVTTLEELKKLFEMQKSSS